MDRRDIGHRFANQDFGKNGHLKAGNVSVDGRNYYSYSTVFAQWLDQEKKVVVTYIGSTSNSSSKHQLWKGIFPDDVHVFPYNDKYRKHYYGYAGCELIWGNDDDEDFKKSHRMTLLNYFIDVQYRQFEYITTAKSKDAELVSFEYWNYAEELCSLYDDTSIREWIITEIAIDDESKRKQKMAKMLLKGERNVQKITDALFGEGVYKKYIDYCERFRRADAKKSQMEWLCSRLGIESPYEGNSRHRYGKENKMTAAQIRKLTAKERNELHFRSLAWKAWEEYAPIRKAKYAKNKRNAYRWIIGTEPVLENQWSDTNFKRPLRIINKDNGEEYDIDGRLSSISWCSNFIKFDYDQYRKSQNKEQWIQNFYTQCKVVSEVITAYNILERVDAHYVAGEYSWYKRYVDDEHLVSSTTPEEYAKCKEFIDRQEKFYNDLEARKRAEAIRRQREEEERKREKELQEQLKAEQIQECLANGVEGGRNLWRFHYMSINEAKSKSNIPDFQFYDGGNVLMRFGMKKDLVETSMSIKLDIPTCKKFWKLINIWHKDPSKFKECKIDTHYSGTYTIVSYENDILTAGCHKIAYSEMERMYNAIIEHEKEVA